MSLAVSLQYNFADTGTGLGGLGPAIWICLIIQPTIEAEGQRQ